MMEWYWALSLFLAALVVLLLTGLPVVFAFLGLNFLGALIFLGGAPGLLATVRNSVDAVTNVSLSPIPLFLLMGEVMFHTGLAKRAIEAVDRLISAVPGRLSLVAVSGGTVFAALSGSSIANVAMLGSTLIPEMRRRGYHTSMSVGPILGTGGLAVLIPPSALAVLLASLGGISVSGLLIGGILPGLVMATFYFIYVIVRCSITPALAPRYEVGAINWGQRITPFLIHVVPLFLIFVVVIGSMLGGYASPTESAALGSVASIAAAAGYRALRWRDLVKAFMETTKISVMILFIICASLTFAQILAFSGAADGVLGLIKSWDLAPLMLVGAMLLILLFLGCFIDQVSMMMITLPFFMPLVKLMGLDPIWFGVLMLILLEVGLTTPPFGLLLFVMKGVVPDDISMRDIYAAAAPFIAMTLLTVILIIAFPPIATWLPGFLK